MWDAKQDLHTRYDLQSLSLMEQNKNKIKRVILTTTQLEPRGVRSRMSLANYRRPSIRNPYSPLHSTLTTAHSEEASLNLNPLNRLNPTLKSGSHSTDETSSSLFFGPRRVYSCTFISKDPPQDHASWIDSSDPSRAKREESDHKFRIQNGKLRRSRAVSEGPLPLRNEENTNTETNNLSSSSSWLSGVLTLLKPGTLFRKNISTNNDGEVGTVSSKRASEYTKVTWVPSKRRRYNIDPIEDNALFSGDTTKKNDKDMKLSISKDPFGWSHWETERIGAGTEDSKFGNSAVNGTKFFLTKQYGTTFIRRAVRRRRRRQCGAQETPAINEYLRRIYNGENDSFLNRHLENCTGNEYSLRSIYAGEKERQLALMASDRNSNTNDTSEKSSQSGLRGAIIDITERIRNLLLLEGKRKKNKEERGKETDNGPLQVIRPGTTSLQLPSSNDLPVSTLEAKRKRFQQERDELNMKIESFNKEFKQYRELIQERIRLKASIKQQRREAAAKAPEVKQRPPPLIPEDSTFNLKLISTTFNRTDNATLLTTPTLEIKVHDFKTLAPGRWLNDTIIEYFMNRVESISDKTVAFNSFFYTNLASRGYSSVRRWLKRKKAGPITSLSKILVPINLQQIHWALSCIDIAHKKISYLDSLSRGNTKPSPSTMSILETLKRYVCEESQFTIGDDFTLEQTPCPQQSNGYDCGVFVCLNALSVVSGRDWDSNEPLFDEGDASRMRSYIADTILKGA